MRSGEPKRYYRPLRFRRALSRTGPRTARQIATDLRSGGVHSTYELARARVDLERAAVAVDHAHVGVDAVERHQCIDVVAEPRVVVPRHRDERRQVREATGAARQAFWHGCHLARAYASGRDGIAI